MRKITETIYKTGEIFVKILFVIFSLFLAVGALLVSESANNMEEQRMVFAFDRLYITIPVILVIALVGWGVVRIVSRNYKTRLRILRWIIVGWYLVMGGILFLFARSCPGADAMSVYSMADMVSRGDLSIIAGPELSYMSYYPQQIGLTTFLALFLKILHMVPLPVAEYHLLKFPYLILVCIATLLQEKIVRKMWENDASCCIFLYLSAINLPLIFYSTFIYSEIPAYFFFTAGAGLLCECLSKSADDSMKGRSGKRTFILMGLSILLFAIAVLIRKNTLVLLLAVLIVAFFQWLIKHKWEWLVYTVLCAIVCVSILPAVISIYERIAGDELSEGVTATSYIAMGMQDTSGRGPGWYNGFNILTFEQAGYDTNEANRISRLAIDERKAFFKNNPAYAFEFYIGKISTQWFDGTYASLQATQATESNRYQFFNELFYGKYKAFYDEYCNGLQSLVYLGAFFCMIYAFKNRQREILWKYIFAIGVFGGFLFHILWEANSRYIVTYSFLLIPYAAKGIAAALGLSGKSEKQGSSDLKK